MSEHPFQPGARVAVVVRSFGYDIYDYRKDFVLKVHKSGRFTLNSHPGRQWRPWRDHTAGVWRAIRTGDYSYSLLIWDDTTDAEISAQMTKTQRWRRLRKTQDALEELPFCDAVTDEWLTALEALLAQVPKQ